MSQRVTLDLPDELAQRARAAAARSRRPFEELILEWIDRAVAAPPVESLPDDQVLVLCDSQMPVDAQGELSDLLDRNREGQLAGHDRQRLDELLGDYQQGLVRKAHAWQVAVQRGLKPALS